MTRRTTVLSLCLIATLSSTVQAEERRPKTIVLIAGKKSHGPGHHEYVKDCHLLREALETSPNVKGVKAIVIENGWPVDESALDQADTIFMTADGADHGEANHPLLVGERFEKLEQRTKKGVGFVALHYTTFLPNRLGDRTLDLLGGYFDYQSGPPPRHWLSDIAVYDTTVAPATPDHPVLRGIEPFPLTEEYYFKIRFRPRDARWRPLLNASIPPGKGTETIAWSVERAEGGRSVGFTGGHFHANWMVPEYRRFVLNALLWTAKADVPNGGVQSTLPKNFEMEPAKNAPLRALIVTGDQHPAHDWKATTKALVEVLGRDPRIKTRVVDHVELLPREEPSSFDVLVLNYNDHVRPDPAPASRTWLLDQVSRGKGLVVVHFANGAFRQWADFRALARRVWIDGKSGHDPYGAFRVEIANRDHPLTRGMSAYETTDELYFSQQGDAPIEPLITARSKVTGRDEPLAFAYHVGQGRVVQTLLGHDTASILSRGTAEFLRRSVNYVGGRPSRPVKETPNKFASSKTSPVKSADPLQPGRFGKALNPRGHVFAAKSHPAYSHWPITVEAHARCDSADQFNVLVAHASKQSSSHWELYAEQSSGKFCAYIPGWSPSTVRSEFNIADGAWHHLAATFTPNRCRLFVDGKQVADEVLSVGVGLAADGPLHIAGYPPGALTWDGLVDEIRLSAGARSSSLVPDRPLQVEPATIGLWRFDAIEADLFKDESSLAQPVWRDASFISRQEIPIVEKGDSSAVRPADAGIQTTSIHQSATNSYLSLRVDGAGRLFAGGREKLFVFEPTKDGGFEAPKVLFRFPDDAWLSDIAIRGDDLYVMTSTALHRLQGARLQRDGLIAERLVWGLPLDLHVSYHCLAWGADGKLYFNHGDPLLNFGDFDRRPDHVGVWTAHFQPAGSRLPCAGVGGFYRCDAEGRHLEFVAGGVRGAFGLCFNRDGHLFSNDNDHETIPSRYTPARLLHVAPRADFLWPRGWTAERTPERLDLLETMTLDMGREVPVGLACLDDPRWPPDFRGNLLLAKWGQRRVDRYVVRPQGSTFKADPAPFLLGEGIARPVGVTVGPDGRVFVSVSHMRGNEWSPRYPSEIVCLEPATKNSTAFVPYEPPSAQSDRLWSELACDSLARREIATVELHRRGADSAEGAVQRLLTDPNPRRPDARLLVSLSAAALTNGKDSGRARAVIRDWALIADPPVRRAALEALASIGDRDIGKSLRAALDKGDSSIQLAALGVLFGLDQLWAPIDSHLLQSVMDIGCSSDRQLRQIACRFLAERVALKEWGVLLTSTDPSRRLAGVLAAGFRLTLPKPNEVPPSPLPRPYTSTNAKFLVAMVDGTIDLKASAAIGSYTIADRWKSVPHDDQQNALFDGLAARLKDDAPAVRRQAAYFLDLLDDPRTAPTIARLRQDEQRQAVHNGRQRPIVSAWTLGPIDAHTAQSLTRGPIDLAATFGPNRLTWKKLSDAGGSFPPPIGTGVALAWFRLQSDRPTPALLTVESARTPRILHNGRELPWADEGIVSLQPGGNDIVLCLPATSSPATPWSVRFRAPDQVRAEIAAPMVGDLNDRLKAGSQRDLSIPAELLSVDWSAEMKKGDRQRGRRLFGADGLGCVKCHAMNAEQTTIGAPSLAGANRRFTLAHLVESVLLPSRQVAEQYRATLVTTTEGEVLTGLVVARSPEGIELLLSNGSRRTLRTSEVDAERLVEQSPMPAGLIKKPDELADLLAYLTSEDPLPP